MVYMTVKVHRCLYASGINIVPFGHLGTDTLLYFHLCENRYTCDITSGALSKIENGKTTPSVIAFYKLSQVLECDMNWLATGISSNMQKSNICKLEEELLNGFRELPEDDKEELMGLLQLKLRKVKKERDVTAKSSGLMGTENGDMVG